MPMPAPITTRAAIRWEYGVSAATWTVKPRKPVAATAVPTTTIRPGAKRSDSRPENCMVMPVASACGMPSRPTSVALWPRTSW